MLKKKLKKLINLFGYDLINLKARKPHTTFEIMYYLLDIILKDKKTFTMFDVGSYENAKYCNEIQKNYLFKKKDKIVSEFYLFEPNKLLLEKLKKNNKDKRIYDFGLGAIKEEKKFYIHEVPLKSSFLEIKQSYFKKRLNYQINEEIVKIETLDNFCFDNGVEYIDFLKIDTQGYNAKVIEGAKDLLKNNKIGLIFSEITIGKKYEISETFYDFEKILKDNYLLYGIDIGDNLINVMSRRYQPGLNFDVFYINKKFIEN